MNENSTNLRKFASYRTVSEIRIAAETGDLVSLQRHVDELEAEIPVTAISPRLVIMHGCLARCYLSLGDTNKEKYNCGLVKSLGAVLRERKANDLRRCKQRHQQ